MPLQGIDRASVAQASGSGTGDTKVGSWWLNLVAKRSTIGLYQVVHTTSRSWLFRVHSADRLVQNLILKSDEGQADCLHLQGIDVPVCLVWIPKTLCMKGAHVSPPSAVGCVRVKGQILERGSYWNSLLENG
ncbi:hypothetical protein ACOMHN_015150 [Nucella lapillus]